MRTRHIVSQLRMMKCALSDLSEVKVRYRGDICACSERLTAKHYNAADAIARIVCKQCRAGFIHQHVIERIRLLRPMQGDDTGSKNTIARFVVRILS